MGMAIVKLVYDVKEYTVFCLGELRGKEHCKKSETLNSVEQRYRTVKNSEIG